MSFYSWSQQSQTEKAERCGDHTAADEGFVLVVLPPPVVLDVIVFPEVAQGNVTSNEHGNSTNTSFLHIDVFVVISVIASTNSTNKSIWGEVSFSEPRWQFPKLDIKKLLLGQGN